MRVPFSELPGAHERHYRRKLGNRLFDDAPQEVDPDRLLEVQRLDHEALVAFIQGLRTLVAEAAALPPNVESDVVLSLKERLDKAYETACGLADQQQGNKNAIRRLVEVIMQVVHQGAAGDPRAEQELAQEEQARGLHFRLLEYPLVADLLSPESPIGEEELVATLLSAEQDELEAALEIFDAEQLSAVAAEGHRLLTRLAPPGGEFPDAQERLALIDECLASTLRRYPDG